MRLGKVIGRVTLTVQDPAYHGARWLIVSPLDKKQLADPESKPLSDIPSPIVYDELGAGVGDIIGFSEGGEATRPFDKPTPVDAYNACIIDTIYYQPN